MSRIIYFIIFLLVAFNTQMWAAEDWQEFKQNHEKFYYYLEQTDVQNFSCLFTTDTYISFIKEIADSSYTYPLKLIWTREGTSYYILEPYPQPVDSKQRQRMMQKIQMTKTQFQGFYLDWINFLILSPFADVPESARIKFQGDTVLVDYQTEDESGKVSIKKTFLSSGRLLKIAIDSPTGEILNYPKFVEKENKWLCNGWDTQIMKGDFVTSGLATRVEVSKIGDYWVPVRADVLVQTADKPGERFISEIFLKNYVFNIPLQKLPSPNPPENLKPGN
jgi:hypothetical protein